jgi:hypothetical protein
VSDKPFRGQDLSPRIRQTELPAVETIRCIYTPEFVLTDRRPPDRPPTSLEEERRELLDSVVQALKTAEPDSDRLAVCGGLLRHLARAGRRL